MNAIDLALEALDEVGLQKESFAAPKPPAPPKPPQPLQPSLSGRQQREI